MRIEPVFRWASQAPKTMTCKIEPNAWLDYGGSCQASISASWPVFAQSWQTLAEATKRDGEQLAAKDSYSQ